MTPPNRTHRTLLAIARSDATFERMDLRGQEVWQGKCIHCNAKLLVDAVGRPVGRVTIEHIVPRHHGGTDALRNLALACARCNHQKGVRHDHQRADDPRLLEVIATLQLRRSQRWRDDDEA